MGYTFQGNEDSLFIYYKELGQIKEKYKGIPYGQERERELLGAAQSQDWDAIDELVERNLNLVVSVAKTYSTSLPLLDLVQEGNMGLMKAIESFDLSKNNRFSTYAVQWIKQSINRGLENTSKPIRVPADVFNNQIRIKSTENSLALKLQRKPTDKEIADALGLTVKVVRHCKDAEIPVSSIDIPLAEDDTETIGSLIEDEFRFEDVTMHNEGQQQIIAILRTLSDREANILIYRFGFTDNIQHTLEETGKQFNLTKERIRQIENVALEKLRHPLRAAALKECMYS